MSGQHALLSASGADRWIHCPPSVRLCENEKDQSTDYAAEGTDAHALCEYLLNTSLGRQVPDPREGLSHYDQEMQDSAEGYVSYVTDLLEETRLRCPHPLTLAEQRVDFSRWAPGGFGTADCLILADGTMHVVDFKYGKGVAVDADHNPQMMLYALGALDAFGDLYDAEAVTMTIYQPRRNSISECTLTVQELTAWAEETLKPAAELAYRGEGEFACGAWCRFCKARATCRKRAEENLKLARMDFAPGPLLSDEEVAEVLAQIDDLTAWASDIKAYALSEAIKGREWNGYKLVEGRSNRQYTDPALAARLVAEAGYDPYEKKLLGITAMTRLLGKKKFGEILGGCVEKPRGKPTLVPIDDKRPAVTAAELDFKEET